MSDKKTRYYYHLGYYGNYPNISSWTSTNNLIEVTKEGYNRILIDEKRIKEETGLSGWHLPVKYRGIPKDKIIWRSLDNNE